MTMRPELKQKWIAALRSGEYVQGRERLYDDNYGQSQPCYCCLGVLCQIGDVPQDYTTVYDWHRAGDLGHGELLEWAGLSIGQQSQLVAMNDTREFTFPQIADWIEVNL